MKQLKTAASPNIPAAKEIRQQVDKQVWHGARNAVHKQVTAEVETREANANWRRMKKDLGNYAWDQVWQTVGDPHVQPVLRGAFDVGAVFCERPAKVSVNGSRVTMEFRDGWRVG